MSNNPSSVSTRDLHVFMAKLAERAERYQDMVDHIKAIAKDTPSLSIEERNLLSVGYKNVVGARRASWRIVSTIEHKEGQKEAGSVFLGEVAGYRGRIEGELESICRDALSLLDGQLIPAADGDETRVFYLKM